MNLSLVERRVGTSSGPASPAVLLIASPPETAEQPSLGAALRAFGWQVQRRGFDLLPDRGDEPAAAPPQLLLVDARDRLEAAHRSLATLRASQPLARAATMLAVTESQLGVLDQLGADDFIVAPVSPAELDRRLRRLVTKADAASNDVRLELDDLSIDTRAYEAYLKGQRLPLALQELELLKFLVQHRGRVWTRDELLARLWRHRRFVGSRTVDIHVRRLRAKLGSPLEARIQTVRGVGYKMI